jgi:multisubunit Na+/H+ antiporter MnhB subunit
MADDTDSTGLGLIAGLVLAAAVVFLAIAFGPRLFNAGPTPKVDINITAPSAPSPKG